jgi:hypothetical protein
VNPEWQGISTHLKHTPRQYWYSLNAGNQRIVTREWQGPEAPEPASVEIFQSRTWDYASFDSLEANLQYLELQEAERSNDFDNY